MRAWGNDQVSNVSSGALMMFIQQRGNSSGESTAFDLTCGSAFDETTATYQVS